MIKKHSVLAGIVISLILISIAISLYPGGTMFNEYSVGFNWSKNFMSNLFGTRALNGAENPSRIWASAAMFILPLTYAAFFINTAKKIPEKNASRILKYAGVANIPFTFLTITSWHDSMLIVSTMLFWTCLIVITVFILKTRLVFLKFYCVITMLGFYYSVYLWGISDWHLLPITQKLNFASSTLLILAVEYFVKVADFTHLESRSQKLTTKG